MRRSRTTLAAATTRTEGPPQPSRDGGNGTDRCAFRGGRHIGRSPVFVATRAPRECANPMKCGSRGAMFSQSDEARHADLAGQRSHGRLSGLLRRSRRGAPRFLHVVERVGSHRTGDASRVRTLEHSRVRTEPHITTFPDQPSSRLVCCVQDARHARPRGSGKAPIPGA